ncbi:MAG: C25 family cysteine peptidase [Candidatus Cloacimonadota bacterium]|nr:C25 family cysteine peptidase [Candidatus Cloacimonadota bacterium]
MKRKNRILIISTIILTFTFTFICLFAGPKEDYEKGLREELSKIFDNPEEIEQFIEHAENFKPTIKKQEYPETTTKGENKIPYDMIIITNAELEQDFLEFATIKNREGIKTQVVSILQTGNTPQEIRQYLKTRKERNPNLKYVLIGGDASVIMPKMIWNPYYHQWAESCIEGYGSEFPTDYYFCNVLSDWVSDDEVNFEADLYVGRIPADTPEEVQNFINKYIAYRYNGNYSEKYHLIAQNLAKIPYDTGGNYIINRIAEHINTDIAYTYEEDLYHAEPGDTIRPGVLWGEAIASNNFSFLFNVAHGHRKCIGAYNIMCNANSYPGPPPPMGLPPFENTNIVTINDTICLVGNLPYHAPEYYEYLPPYLSNTNPYLFWSSSCRGNLFAMIDTNYVYFPAECVGAEFINSPDGAVALYASSFLEFPYTTRHSVEDFMDFIFDNEMYRIGENCVECHQYIYQYGGSNCARDLILSHVLFGDPSMQIWSEKARVFNVYRLKSENEELAVFWVLDKEENPVSNVRCNLISEGNEIFLRGFTDEEGVVEFEIGKEDISEMELTTIKANFIPYSSIVEEIPYYGKGDEDLGSESDISLCCYPNPMHSSTTISFSATDLHGLSQIKIYNVKGQLVKRFGDLTGKDKVIWSGKDNRGIQLSNGIYFYRMETDKYKSEISKILMLR